ncbi:ABC transporter permease [Thermoactinomyces sp. CICC 10522]|uniref:ABC transporter permease n=1 Tax=Thermoactinomyces sp. CICC 10522 TaxID=2767427 RepID=UPI0018DC376E|nr:ABC transporter permease [Thermoactinomyces sp. CICC 10522]MBH8605553.1 ABC transporter permease [Thermoactinomyces sp. CICC 10522]
MSSMIGVEFIKFRRSWMVWLIGIVPFAFCTLLGLALRFYLQTNHTPEQGWGLIFTLVSRFLWQVIAFTVPIFTSYLVSMEQLSNTWKQIFVMPLAKWKVYLAKFFWALIFTLVMGILFVLGVYFICLFWDIEHLVTINQLIFRVYSPFMLAIPYISFQLWISMVSRNQTTPIAIGIAAIILAPVFKNWGWWTPWGFWSTFLPAEPTSYQALFMEKTTSALDGSSLLLSVLFGAIWLAIGVVHFYQKEFN